MAPNRPRRPGRRVLTDEQEQAMIGAFVGGASYAEVARAFGVAVTTVQRVFKRRGISAKARPSASAAAARPDFREAFEALGEPPDDPVLAAEYMHRGLSLAFRQTATDPAYDARPAERNKALVQISRAASASLPAATLARTKRLIAADAAERDGGHRGPALEPPPPNGHRSTRGRPRREA